MCYIKRDICLLFKQFNMQDSKNVNEKKRQEIYEDLMFDTTFTDLLFINIPSTYHFKVHIQILQKRLLEARKRFQEDNSEDNGRDVDRHTTALQFAEQKAPSLRETHSTV
jgi:ribonuclease HII